MQIFYVSKLFLYLLFDILGVGVITDQRPLSYMLPYMLPYMYGTGGIYTYYTNACYKLLSR